jgi:hypothetical protein
MNCKNYFKFKKINPLYCRKRVVYPKPLSHFSKVKKTIKGEQLKPDFKKTLFDKNICINNSIKL